MKRILKVGILFYCLAVGLDFTSTCTLMKNPDMQETNSLASNEEHKFVPAKALSMEVVQIATLSLGLSLIWLGFRQYGESFAQLVAALPLYWQAYDRLYHAVTTNGILLLQWHLHQL